MKSGRNTLSTQTPGYELPNFVVLDNEVGGLPVLPEAQFHRYSEKLPKASTDNVLKTLCDAAIIASQADKTPTSGMILEQVAASAGFGSVFSALSNYVAKL